MAAQESVELAQLRWRDLELLQDHYADFGELLIDCMEFLGFQTSDIQLDIADWIANGPQYRMVQAQRGQAKTTITAIFAIYKFIHKPNARVLIISAGSDMATEIANLIIQIIMGMPELACLRPDRSAGDRASVEAFDVHHSLKGPEKSPSVACIGITSNMQGKRADLLIPDDIESSKNSQTQTQRARLLHLTLDFTSINSKGDIVWLGTPQSIDSLYNGLPGRGTVLRVWPGRYPTAKEIPDYDGYLAPLIAERIAKDPKLQTGGGPTGDRGKPVDPLILNEADLTKKEIDQGAAYFQLQHMLSTKLSDKDRFPLKVSQIRFLNFDYEEKSGPMTLNFIRNEANQFTMPDGFPLKDKVYAVQDVSDFGAIEGWHMHIDPAGGGQNGDEIAYGMTGFLAGRVFLGSFGGMRGGLNDPELDWLTAVALKWKPKTIAIEKNYGNGALANVWLPRLRDAQKKAGQKNSEIEEVWEAGQKELRIIDIMEPVIGAGKLVVRQDLIEEDWAECMKYSGDVRSTYSFFWQLARITRDRNSLIHDDRLDAVAGSVRKWVEYLSIDDAKAVAAAKNDLYRKMMTDPLGNGRGIPGLDTSRFGIQGNNALSKHNLGAVGHLDRFSLRNGVNIHGRR